MSRHRLAAASVYLGLCFAVPFAANAQNHCARGEADFCLGTPNNAPSRAQARSTGWAQWASGARMRLDGAPAGESRAIEPDETEAAAQPHVGRIPLEAAAPGGRLYPRAGYGARLQSVGPAGAALYGSYALSESFSLDVTAGKGRIGLRTVGAEPAYGAGTGLGLATPGFDRTAWSVALNASRQIGALGIGGRIGYVDVRDQPEVLFDSGASALKLGGERTTNLRKSFLGIDASYELGRNWQLHGGAMYRRDEGRSALLTGLGPLQFAGDEREWGVGVRYYGWRNFRLNLEYLKTSGREQFGNESVLFMGRFDF